MTSLRQKSNLRKMKSRFSTKLNKGLSKLTRNRMSMTSLDRNSPMCFDGPNSINGFDKENEPDYNYDIHYEPTVADGGSSTYNERAVDPDRHHVESGAYRERCVDPELEDPAFMSHNMSHTMSHTDPAVIKSKSSSYQTPNRNSKRRISKNKRKMNLLIFMSHKL